MGRKKVLLSLDEDTLLKVEQILHDPVNKKRKYGALSAIIDSLLIEWTIKQITIKKGK